MTTCGHLCTQEGERTWADKKGLAGILEPLLFLLPHRMLELNAEDQPQARWPHSESWVDSQAKELKGIQQKPRGCSSLVLKSSRVSEQERHDKSFSRTLLEPEFATCRFSSWNATGRPGQEAAYWRWADSCQYNPWTLMKPGACPNPPLLPQYNRESISHALGSTISAGWRPG